MNRCATDVWLVRIPFVSPLITAHGVQTHRNAVILRIRDSDGYEGWGECVADNTPYTAPESAETAYAALTADGDDIAPWPGRPGRPLVSAVVAGAFDDLAARRTERPLAALYGAEPGPVEVGAVIAHDSVEAAVAAAGRRLQEGYRRIKLKVRGNDWEAVKAVRGAFPAAPLAVDANGSLDTNDLDIDAVDRLALVFVEQPFGVGDWSGHAEFRRRSSTPVCLDESVRSVGDLEQATALEAVDIVAIKPGTVGGVAAAAEIASRARRLGTGVLVGGMLETGIGRGHALAFARSPTVTQPADLPGSAHYLAGDLTDRWQAVEGVIMVPAEPGLGRSVDMAALEEYTTAHHRGSTAGRP